MPKIVREPDGALFMPEAEFKCHFCKENVVRGVRRVVDDENGWYRYVYSCPCRGTEPLAGVSINMGISSLDVYKHEMDFLGSSFLQESATERLSVCQDLLRRVIGGLLGLDVREVMGHEELASRRAIIQHALEGAPNLAAKLLTVDDVVVALDGEIGQDWAEELPGQTSSRWDFLLSHGRE